MSRENERNKPDLIAYAVTGSGERSFYHRIGVAWRNSVGGAKVVLTAFPVNGELLLLPPREQGEADASEA